MEIKEVWYRGNFEWTDGNSSSAPLGDNLEEALVKFEKEKESWCDIKFGLLRKVTLTKHELLEGERYANSKIIKRPTAKKLNEKMYAKMNNQM